MKDERLPGEMTLTDVQRLWKAKWDLERSQVWNLVAKKGVLGEVRRTPARFYVSAKAAHEYIHNQKRGKKPEPQARPNGHGSSGAGGTQ